LKDAKNNTVIADNNYTYNAAGQITQNLDQSGTHVYGYDAPDRLTSATYTGTPAESYAYDAVGNRTSSHRSATYNYQPFNRLTSTSTATYLYNNNGNMISKSDASGTTQFAWDFENRLVQVVTPSAGSASYKYDALGRRIQRTPSSGISTNFVYDGQDVVKDINSDGSTVEYLNGPGIDNKIRQKGSSTSTTYYFSQDHLGSPTALTGTTGKLVERITYDAYGNSAGSTRTRYGLTGRERDSLTGLLYYRARFYDPQLGRFISEDPIGLAGGINSFAYVGNNPVLYRDPSGLCPQNPKGPTACEAMAINAQNAANKALGSAHGDANKALRPFDDSFSKIYIGHAMHTYAQAIDLYQHPPHNSSRYTGQTGFRDEFLDSENGQIDRSPDTDQTHHFAAYFSGGINGQWAATTAHAWEDRVKHRNMGDYNLGNAAYGLGAQLGSDPSLLKNVGNMIRQTICK